MLYDEQYHPGAKEKTESQKLNESQLYISHEFGCPNFEQFFDRLTRSKVNKVKQLEHEGEEGYLRQPLKNYTKDMYNLKCCCQSHVVHRESDKFMIANEKGHDQKLSKGNIFEKMEDGEPEIDQKSFENIKGMKDNWTNIFPRKEEVQEILVFLKEVNKILVVVGPTGIGRIYTIGRAIRFAVEHDYESVQDGAYHIDLSECQTIVDIYKQLIEMLGLSIHPDLNQILNDTYLKQQRSVIVFQNLPFDDETLLFKFIKFVKRLKYNCELHFILIVESKEAQRNNIFSQEEFPMLTMQNMEKTEAIEFLKRLLYLERKTEFLRGIDLETHKVIQMWEKSQFADKEAFRIVNQLTKRRKLIDIANDMEKRQSISDPNQAQVDVDTALSSFTVLQQMWQAKEKLFNDFIIFLTVCPSGLGLTEVEIVLRMLPSELSADAKAKHIAFYMEIFTEMSSGM